LRRLTVKELNRRLQNMAKRDIKAIKERRRTLKNRG
jgi:hypothetical protein